jgi:DNA-binding CsgD family transcriptional regulator
MPSAPGDLLLATAATGELQPTMAAVAATVRQWVGAGPVFLAAADPATGAFSSAFTFDVPADAAAAFNAIEMTGTDVTSFHTLAQQPRPIGSLYAATDGSPQDSARWRTVISALRWGDELRAAIRADGQVWGYLCLHRESGDRPYRHADVRRLEALLPLLAESLRSLTARAAPADGHQLGTGVLLLDPAGRIAGLTGDADSWLSELGADAPFEMPLVISGLVALAERSRQPQTATISTLTGRLATVEVAQVDVRDGGTGHPIVVVLTPASSQVRLDRLSMATRLTPREREVVDCVLNGMSTRAMAARLDISERTVQTHLTSVFAKTATSSRRQLASLLRS